jgi:zinc transporter ZupT
MKWLLILVLFLIVLETCQSTELRSPSIVRNRGAPTKRSDESQVAAVLSLRGGSSVISLPNISLQTFKLFLQLGLTAFNVLCWLIPLQQKGFSQNAKALSIASCFSGGVFLALSMTHLLPESVEHVAEMNLPAKSPFLACLFGYFLILFVEKVAFDSHGMLHEVVGHAHGGNDKKVGGAMSSKSAVVLLIAMSLHSLIETVALGITKDKTSAAMMAASIGLHQPAETLALLVAFLKTSLPTDAIIKYLTCFSIIGPLGVTLGLIINKVASSAVDALIVAVTAGTFIYMGATEVANEEFEDATRKERFARYGAMLLGVSTIYKLTSKAEQLEGLAGGHGHSHG